MTEVPPTAILSPDRRYQWLDGQWQPVPSGSDGKAIASLVLSIAWLGGLGSIAGVVLGHASETESRRSGRRPSGLALAGQVIGYVGIAFLALGIILAIAIPTYLNQRAKGYESQAREALRDLALLQEGYHLENRTYTDDLDDLSAATYTPSASIAVQIVSATRDSYCLSAATPSSSRTYYYSYEDGFSRTPCA